jgi:transcriptional regulator with XRE-family HTH domain
MSGKKHTFGNLVKRLREEKGLSAYALAKAAGVSDQSVANIEQRDAMPSLDTARRLAAVLGFSIDGLPPVDLPKQEPGRPRGRPKKTPAK